jgi:hypothetical protein
MVMAAGCQILVGGEYEERRSRRESEMGAHAAGRVKTNVAFSQGSDAIQIRHAVALDDLPDDGQADPRARPRPGDQQGSAPLPS